MQEQGRGTEKSRWNSQCHWPEPEGYDSVLFRQVPLRRDVEIWRKRLQFQQPVSSFQPQAPVVITRRLHGVDL